VADLSISGVQVRGVSAAVPSTRLEVSRLSEEFGESEIRKIVKSTGIHEVRVARRSTASDLCVKAASTLLAALEWPAASIDVIIFVTQTPDWRTPATACSLQHRLGIAKTCAALDINLACSGYVYGLCVAAGLIGRTKAQRILLLAGDTMSKLVDPGDRATAPLFGDAGTCTALEFEDSAPDIHFNLGSDGSGVEHLKVPLGGLRPARVAAFNGSAGPKDFLHMNGAEVFAFTLREVPASVRAAMTLAKWAAADVLLLHQANGFMVETLRKRLNGAFHSVPNGVRNFGNTSGASIPLAIVTQIPEYFSEQRRAVLSGFGAGLSWATAAMTLGPMVVCPLEELHDNDATHA
jgi:3-oxoacyl-[acyl-carrier-protein] synthase III